MTLPPIPRLPLNDGNSIPQLGFGVFKVPDDETQAAVELALESGYRSIDTAAFYQNERGVGRGLAASGLPRDDMFVTSKVWNDQQGAELTRASFEHSLDLLGLDRLDLFLIHWPVPSRDLYVETWQTLIGLREQGLVTSIGVSNFEPAHLERLITETGVVPAINQVELHPYLTQQAVRDYDAEHHIATEAWSPLAKGGDLLSETVLTAIAAEHGKSPAQVVIRWHLQRGTVVIPKSVTPSRVRENLDVFDFDLTASELEAIGSLDRDLRTGPNPNVFVLPPAA
ncbi:aldo/keto reductase [Gryllotalpicola reticulitermitis]|uniref:Aldo/keto reductase n=1 Tax=Gryllotalpicola reticulitermitis TaxID=1184153 RepID=A0ABV8Q733_9MICO